MSNIDEHKYRYKAISLYDALGSEDIYFRYSETNIVPISEVPGNVLLNNEYKLVKRVEITWRDAAMEFVEEDSELSKDLFLRDIFSDKYPEYHDSLLKLCKLVTENAKG